MRGSRQADSAAEALTGEISGLLADLQDRYAGRPEQERQALLMVAMEREQVVAVAYREDAVAGRVAALPVAEDVRRLIRQTLVWIWKDEEVHTTYMRGYLLRAGRPLPAALVLARQAYGALSGWATATRELATPREAPISTLAARLMIAGGTVVGLVPPAVARELQYRSFRHYCQLNTVLERTAELAYRRLTEIAPSAEESDLFERVADDERRHGEAFTVLAGILDEHDQPAGELDHAEVRRRLAAISPWYIPADQRSPSAGGDRRVFGRPSPVTVRAAASADGLAGVVDETLGGAGLDTLLGHGDGARTVAIRTSFMLGYDSSDRSNVVSPEVLDRVAAYALDHGATTVRVVEAPTVYGRYYRHRAVAEVAAYFGYTSPRYEIVDAGADQVPFAYQRGLQQNTISRTWLEADVRIVVAKLRTDPNEFGHLCLSTLEGMASQIDETVYTGRSVEFRTATMMLLDVAPPDVAVVDAWGPIADGPVGVMGCHRPAHARRLYAGRDPLNVDRAVLADMGLRDPSRVPIVRRAVHWFGIDLTPVEVDGSPGLLGDGFRNPWSRRTWRAFAALSGPVYFSMSGEGRLFVPQMDEHAFPPSRPEGVPVRAVRRGAQLAFGLRPPGRH